MKTTVSKLRTLIREYIELPREELVKMINDMPPDEVATEDFDDYEDDDDYMTTNDLLMNAVKEFASHISNDLPDDTDAQDVAPDMAENFFYEYPQWKEWAREVKMKKWNVKEIVTDAVYDALTK